MTGSFCIPIRREYHALFPMTITFRAAYPAATNHLPPWRMLQHVFASLPPPHPVRHRHIAAASPQFCKMNSRSVEDYFSRRTCLPTHPRGYQSTPHGQDARCPSLTRFLTFFSPSFPSFPTFPTEVISRQGASSSVETTKANVPDVRRGPSDLRHPSCSSPAERTCAAGSLPVRCLGLVVRLSPLAVRASAADYAFPTR